jgi:pimeloyl-ACP methyl ester carboxylesterase
VRERALSFGPANLVGILTEPDPGAALPGAPAWITLNSGILHRAGASRMYVRIARALADLGFASFRFDFSGIGDSEVRKDAIAIEERFILETQEAMDYLASARGVDSFVVGGLCSGADGAFWTALEDPRVVGVWQIDAFCYRTVAYRVRRYAPKLLNPLAWVHSIRSRIPEGDTERDEEQFVKPEYRRVFPPREVVGQGLTALRKRNVEMFFFFTGELEDYNYAEQHTDTFPQLDGHAEIVHIPSCSHTVTDLEHQESLLRDLTAWAERFMHERAAAAAG